MKLQKRFPQTSPKRPASKVPLKIGLFGDLVPSAQELGLTELELRDAIRTWCRGTGYRSCLVEGSKGKPVNAVQTHTRQDAVPLDCGAGTPMEHSRS